MCDPPTSSDAFPILAAVGVEVSRASLGNTARPEQQNNEAYWKGGRERGREEGKEGGREAFRSHYKYQNLYLNSNHVVIVWL